MFSVWNKCHKTDKFCSFSSSFPGNLCRCEMLKPQPLCSWDTQAQSPLPFNLTLKCMQTVLFPTHSTLPLCHELQMRSSFHKSRHEQGSWNPGGADWVGLYSGQWQLPATSRLPALEASLHNVIHCCFFTVRVTRNLLFPNAILLCASSLNHLVDWSNDNVLAIIKELHCKLCNCVTSLEILSCNCLCLEFLNIDCF